MAFKLMKQRTTPSLITHEAEIDSEYHIAHNTTKDIKQRPQRSPKCQASTGLLEI